MAKIEFKICGPVWNDWAFFHDVAWCKVSLERDEKSLHHLYMIVKPGSTLYSQQLIPQFEKLAQMYMSTTKGLNP